MLPEELVWPIAIIKWVDIVYNRVERGYFFPSLEARKYRYLQRLLNKKTKIQKNRFFFKILIWPPPPREIFYL